MDNSTNSLNTASKRQLSAWTISILVHAALALAFWFFFKLTPPNPPWGSYGVAVNFGFDETGFGTEQSYEQAGTKENNPQQELNPGNQSPQESGIAPMATGTEESPLQLPNETHTQTTTTTKPESEPNKAQPVNTNKQGGGNTGGASEGNDPGTTGNKGKQGGDLSSLNYEGTPGNGGSGTGASLDLAGWVWEKKPVVDDQSNEEGKIVFQITVDEEGEIVGIRTLEKTVSNKVERIYRSEVEKLTFLKKRGYNAVAGTSTGTITFRIKNF